MNQDTLNFLRAWINWVDAGAPEDKPFSRSSSLCLAKYEYTDTLEVPDDPVVDELIDADLKAAFKSDGLHWNHPFYDMKDKFDSSGYEQENQDGTMHLNDRRLAWVRSKLSES